MNKFCGQPRDNASADQNGQVPLTLSFVLADVVQSINVSQPSLAHLS